MTEERISVCLKWQAPTTEKDRQPWYPRQPGCPSRREEAQTADCPGYCGHSTDIPFRSRSSNLGQSDFPRTRTFADVAAPDPIPRLAECVDIVVKVR